jgi:hypothetical protein
MKGETMEGSISRAAFVARALAATGAAAVLPGVLLKNGFVQDAAAAGGDVGVLETMNGLVAFVVPGNDAFSLAQRESTADPGGVDAYAGPALVGGLEYVQAGLSADVAGLLNGLAVVAKSQPGSDAFSSPFANLAFADKARVFEFLETWPQFEQLRPLTGALPALAAFLSYSEVGVFNPATRTLAGTPLGWTMSGYDGVADGRAELIGYFENRRRVDA